MKRTLVVALGLALSAGLASISSGPDPQARTALTLLASTGGGTTDAATDTREGSHATRCDELRAKLGAGLVNCWDFEKRDDALVHEAGQPGSRYRPAVTIDPGMAASGKSSIRFETISFEEAKRRCPTCTDEEALDTARKSNQSWWGRNFRPDWSVTFGLGDEFWLQMRMRENDGFYAGPWGGDGPKKWILGTGDRWVDFRATLREPLSAAAGEGELILLDATGDRASSHPRDGVVAIDGERIRYRGAVDGQNALMIAARGVENTKATDHGTGAATSVRRAVYAPGCSDLEIPVTQGWNFVPSSYHSCGVKDKRYEGHALPLVKRTSAVDWIIQSGQRGTWNEAKQTWEGGCLFSKKKAGDLSGCLVDRPGQGWMTWTIHVKLAQPRWYANDGTYTHASTLRIWRDDKLLTDLSPENVHPRTGAPSGEACARAPRSLVNALDCLTGYDFARGATMRPATSLTGPVSLSDPGGRYGKIWINLQSWRRQYLDRTNPLLCCHPTVVRWYDDLVVSRVPIPLPDGTPLRP